MKASYTTLLVVGYANAVSVCPPNLHRLLAVRTPDLPVSPDECIVIRAGRSNCPRYFGLAKHRARLSYGPTRQSKKAWFL